MELKPAAKDFLAEVRDRLVRLVLESLSRFGAVEGAVYDDVFGENADKSKIPSYLPVVSHFQVGDVQHLKVSERFSFGQRVIVAYSPRKDCIRQPAVGNCSAGSTVLTLYECVQET